MLLLLLPFSSIVIAAYYLFYILFFHFFLSVLPGLRRRREDFDFYYFVGHEIKARNLCRRQFLILPLFRAQSIALYRSRYVSMCLSLSCHFSLAARGDLMAYLTRLPRRWNRSFTALAHGWSTRSALTTPTTHDEIRDKHNDFSPAGDSNIAIARSFSTCGMELPRILLLRLPNSFANQKRKHQIGWNRRHCIM